MSHKVRTNRSEDLLLPDQKAISRIVHSGASVQSPFVSIIIPVYATEDYLDRCLESACMQTETNIEIIVIDDASPDGSWSIIKKYAQKDSRIIPIRHTVNRHLGGARNTGIDTAKGNWILFLDSDDYIDQDSIRILLNQINKYPNVELIHYKLSHVNYEGKVIESNDLKKNSTVIIKDIFPHYCNLQYPNVYHSACLNIWKRDFLLRNKLRFPENTSMEDFAIFLQWIYRIQSPILYIPHKLYYYQERPDSIIGRFSQQAESMIKVINMLHSWSENLDKESWELARYRIIHEIRHWLSVINYEDIIQFLQSIPIDYSLKIIQQFQIEYRKISHDQWYLFGQLTYSQRIWFVGKTVSRKLGLYRLIKPLAGRIRQLLRIKDRL